MTISLASGVGVEVQPLAALGRDAARIEADALVSSSEAGLRPRSILVAIASAAAPTNLPELLQLLATELRGHRG